MCNYFEEMWCALKYQQENNATHEVELVKIPAKNI